MKLKHLFIAIAILLAVRTIITWSPLSAASPAVSVTPVLRASAQLKLTSTLSAAGSSAVTWSLNPQVGAVSSGGVYTAPTPITLHCAASTAM